MFSKKPDPRNEMDLLFEKVYVVADAVRVLDNRLARIETRLYRLAKALGHEDVMHKDPHNG